LIVDDDMRNIFSLTSALEQHGMQVIFAENGLEGIEKLKANPDVDVMLVDIMMPEMDGYETMREIRKMARYRDLPLVAVTAKAMKGDREKCLEAGATDYVSKPVDIDQLLAVLRVQLGRSTYVSDGTVIPNGASGAELRS
jgi:CheY-like chemotaxis protein